MTSLWPHVLQHARGFPCPSLSPRICLNSYPLNRWGHQLSHFVSPLLLLPFVFLSYRVFSNESAHNPYLIEYLLCNSEGIHMNFIYLYSPQSLNLYIYILHNLWGQMTYKRNCTSCQRSSAIKSIAENYSQIFWFRTHKYFSTIWEII